MGDTEIGEGAGSVGEAGNLQKVLDWLADWEDGILHSKVYGHAFW